MFSGKRASMRAAVGLLPFQRNAGRGVRRRRRLHNYPLGVERLEDRRLLTAGDIEWIRQFGSVDPAIETDFAQAADVDGDVYVVGRTGGSLEGQTSAGSTDAFVQKYDSSGTKLWTRQFGTSASDEASSISVDSSGVYVVGRVSLALPGQTRVGFIDAFVRKYDLSGNELWTRQFGTSGFDEATSITVDASGVYVAGRTDGALPGQTSAGSADAFVRKYDSNGTELWTRQFGSDSTDSAAVITVYASGVYLAGETHGTLPGQSSAGSPDAFVSKYDSNGNELWTRQFGSSSVDNVGGIVVDSSGVYLAGRTDGALPAQNSAGSADAFVRKYDSTGSELWTRQFGSPGFDFASGIAVDASGVYLAGAAGSALPNQTSAGGTDAFVRFYDPNGTELWTRQHGTSGVDRANDISVDASGVYLVGMTDGTFPGQASTGSTDAFVARLSSNTAPIAMDDNYSTDEDTLLSIPVATGVLFNDSDAVVVSAVNMVAADVGTQITLSSGALVTLNSDGSMSYDPNGQFETLGVGVSATNSFTYTVTDSQGATDTATVTVTINGVNDAPIANAGQNQTVLERIPVNLNGSLSSDVDADLLTFAWLQTAGPTVTLSTPSGATLNFTAPVVFSNNTRFDFQLTVTDPSGASDVDTVTITVDADLTTDSDGDGIIDRIDTQPATFSNDFGDDKLYGDSQLVGGTSFGTITQRGDRTFEISDRLQQGKGVQVNVSAGSESFQLLACSPSTEIDVGNNLKAFVDCGSTTVEVVEGEAAMSTLFNGTTVSVAVAAGELTTFDQLATGELTITQSGTVQPAEIETTVEGQTFVAQLDPGESLTYTISPLGTVAAAAEGGEVVLEIDGSPVVLPTGGTLSTIEIEIKPGSSPNTINLGSNGVVPVAILSSSTFDALNVDANTVKLADAGVKLRGNGTPQTTQQDVNNDGLTDLVVHILADALQLTEGDELATLTGQTTGGSALTGTDRIRIVGTLLADAGVEGNLSTALTTKDLEAITSAAQAVWAAETESRIAPSLEFVVADLPAGVLGVAELLPRTLDPSSPSGRITLDVNANGVGWFIDDTPLDHSEFSSHATGGSLFAMPHMPAANRYDLITVVNHEVGHLLGLGHDRDGLMAPVLELGVRRLGHEEHGRNGAELSRSLVVQLDPISDALRPRTSTAFLLNDVDTRAEADRLEFISLVEAPIARSEPARVDRRLLDEAIKRLDDDKEDLTAALEEAIDELLAVD